MHSVGFWNIYAICTEVVIKPTIVKTIIATTIIIKILKIVIKSAKRWRNDRHKSIIV